MANIHENWINVFGVPVVLSKKQEIVEWCAGRLTEGIKTRIVTANPEILLRARRDLAFKKNISGADVITPDGAGVCWAAKFFSLTAEETMGGVKILSLFAQTLWTAVFGRGAMKAFPERVSGSDLFWDFVRLAENLKLKVYLIGGKNGTAQRAAGRIALEHKNLDIRAYRPDHIATPYSSYTLHNEISEFKPDLVFIAYGSPRQEEWIGQNMHRYPSIKLAMGVGGTLDFISGNTVRAPLRLQNHALEWFWRLYQRPSRLVRALRAVAVFPLFILVSRLKRHYAGKFRKNS